MRCLPQSLLPLATLLAFLSLVPFITVAFAESEAPNPIVEIESALRLTSADSPAWSLLRFLPDPSALTSLLLDAPPNTSASPLWGCAVFVPTADAAKPQTLAFLRDTLLPAAAALHARRSHLLGAFVAVLDLPAARAHYARYPFAFLLGSAEAEPRVLPPGRDALLRGLAHLLATNRPLPRHGADGAAPVSLLLRPGAAVYFRAGKALPPLAPPLLARVGELRGFIADVPPHTLRAAHALGDAFVDAYRQAVEAPTAEPRTAEAAGILSEAEATEHRAELQRALQRMQDGHGAARAEGNPYSLESLRGLTPRERVAEVLRRMQQSSEAEDEAEVGAAQQQEEEGRRETVAEGEERRDDL